MCLSKHAMQKWCYQGLIISRLVFLNVAAWLLLVDIELMHGLQQIKNPAAQVKPGQRRV